MNDHDDSFGRKTTRKKMVDLKAVADLLEDDDTNNVSSIGKNKNSIFLPNENLIQETARIKSQRDLILDRIHKMEGNRNRVSKNVFDKVARDYALQLSSINEMLSEKKELLEKELKQLYHHREKLNVDMGRHKEILEEAQFRHYLNEYTEEQYKEVEAYETREIHHLQNDLAKVHSFIKTHEELFDPEDLGLAPQGSAPQGSAPQGFVPQSRTPAVTPTTNHSTSAGQAQQYETKQAPATHTPQAFQDLPPPPSTVDTAILPPPVDHTAEATKTVAPDHFADKTPVPEIPFESKTDPALSTPDSSTDNDYDIKPEGGYFQDVSEAIRLNPPDAAGDEPSLTKKTGGSISSESEKSQNNIKLPNKAPQDDSIFDILNDIPLSDISLKEENPDPKIKMENTAHSLSTDAEPSVKTGGAITQNTPLPSTSSSTATGSYKLVFVEGDTKLPDLVLSDNVSIGRSPSNDLVLNTPKVSRQHAAINKYKEKYILIDLKSSNGIYVNGRKVDEQPLEEGDEISIADYKMVFKKI